MQYVIIIMSHQDWKTIVFNSNKNTPKHKLEVEPVKKYVSNSNTNVDSAKIERDEEEGKKLKTYGLEYGKKVCEARKEKNWTQKQLAQQLNVRQDIVQKLENGSGLVDGNICNKIFRILKVKRN